MIGEIVGEVTGPHAVVQDPDMAVVKINCGFCGRDVAAEIISGTLHQGHPVYIRCVACLEGSVITKDGRLVPGSAPVASVEGLPDDISTAWQEARVCFAASAYTATEIICRKILMHLAVDLVQAPPGKTFIEYVDALDAAGHIAIGLKDTVDKVRLRGNTANHELPASTSAEAKQTLMICEYLLRGIYEMPTL